MSSLTSSKPKLLDSQQVPAQATSIARPSPTGRGSTAFNTPVPDQAPPLAITTREQAQGGRPINAVSAMRGRGLMPPHAVTPGNTPNSLDQIRRRITSTLNGAQRDGQTNKIAPSYERRLHEDLNDLGRRFSTNHEMPGKENNASQQAPAPQLYVGSPKHLDLERPSPDLWPVSFSVDTRSVSSHPLAIKEEPEHEAEE